MQLTKVTLTGADDGTDPYDLIEISKDFPFVEWGILLSRNQIGNKRFPSLHWMNTLWEHLQNEEHKDFHLSGHLCGGFVNDALLGISIEAGGKLWTEFERVQINTHGKKHPYNDDLLLKSIQMCPDKEFIFQYDDANGALHDFIFDQGQRCSALYDKSHGAGIEPDSWPMPLRYVSCGYAGGISPDNVKHHIESINEFAVKKPYWIDMETHIRSDNDTKFDLKKCVNVLKKCEYYIKH